MTYNKKDVDAEFEALYKTLPSDRSLHRSDTASEINGRPDTLERHRAAQTEVMSRPDVKARRSASLKATLATPEAKARKSAASLKVNQNPVTKAKHKSVMKKINASDEMRELRSAQMKEQLSAPEARAKHTAMVNASHKARWLSKNNPASYRDALSYGKGGYCGWFQTADKFEVSAPRLARFALGINLDWLE